MKWIFLSIPLMISGMMDAAYSQNGVLPIARLKEGQPVSDRILSASNAGSSTFKLSDYRGKVVILDFWATWCSSCIAKFPYLDSIQRLHKDKLQIVLVNVQHSLKEKEKVEKFITDYKMRRKDFSLPFIVGDSTLTTEFPTTSVPHYVFIDPSGIYRSTSTGEDITTSQIISFYKGDEVTFHKKDFVDFDRNKPLFTELNGGVERNVVYKSMITHYLSGVEAGVYHNIDRKLKTGSKLYFRNLSAIQLFGIAYKSKLPPSQVVFDVKDKESFILPVEDERILDKTYYCYELTTSIQPVESLYEKFRKDLEDYFGVRGVFEKRMTQCLVIEWKDSTVLKFSKEPKNKVSLGYLRGCLNCWGTPTIPVLSDIKEEDFVNVFYEEKGIQTKDLGQLQKMLGKSGLQVKKELREIELFIITDQEK